MPSTPFYLKYRPKSLDDLIGQDNVKKVLSAALQSGKLSHAYLFVGPRGTGKTSTARILAKMVNCQAESKPCNKCAICLSITDGSNLDLIELDAASNRGIENVRALRETIKLSPSGKGKKVYIIDEVHMLTTEAFNALLKTLEEPPAHALFILATTDALKIPQTILSRVQRLDFSLATQSELKEALDRITAAEKIDIDDEALELIIKGADGSFRDVVKLLDQFSGSKGKTTAKDVLNGLKITQFEDLVNLLKSLSAHDAPAGLLRVSNHLRQGADVKELILSLMDLIRDIMLIKNDLGTQLVKPKWTLEKYTLLLELGEQLTTKDLAGQLNVFQEALTKLKVVSIPSLPLELAVVEICEENSNVKYQMSKPEQTGKAIEDKKLKIEEINSQSSIIQEPPSIAHNPSSNTDSSDDILKLKEKWNFVLETIRPYNFSLEALLRSVNLAECSEKSVVIEVPYSFHQRILEAPKNRDILESILSEVLGRSIKVLTVLGNRPARKEDIANVEVAADDEIIRAAAEIFNSDTVN